MIWNIYAIKGIVLRKLMEYIVLNNTFYLDRIEKHENIGKVFLCHEKSIKAKTKAKCRERGEVKKARKF